jgi:hypothetical protein
MNINSEELIANILEDLRPHIDEEYKMESKNRFKIDVSHSLGVRISLRYAIEKLPERQ